MAIKTKLVENADGAWHEEICATYHLNQRHVAKEAALRSGINTSTINACMDAVCEVLKAWMVEGHTVEIPCFGTFEISTLPNVTENNTPLAKVEKNYISNKQLLFTPSYDLANEVDNTKTEITCIDKNGNIVKRLNK